MLKESRAFERMDTMSGTRYVAWWNVENLFDYENSPRRTEKLRRALGTSIVGWTPALRDAKIDQLVSVIVQMNAGAGPDLLGICEVENSWVVERLASRVSASLGRNYAVQHADLSDNRGIDVSFIYDPAWLTTTDAETFHHVVMRRSGTREIVQVNFQTDEGRTLTVFGNHWPSRSGGQHESAGYRNIAGETLAYFHRRSLEVHGNETPVLVMGDFNDEPFDPSLVRHALSTREAARVKGATSPRLWNLMWPLMGNDTPSYYYGSAPHMIDHVLVNKNMIVQGRPITINPGSVEVIMFPGMFNSAGRYQEPIRFGGMGKAVNQAGFSDHFPIGFTVTEAP